MQQKMTPTSPLRELPKPRTGAAVCLAAAFCLALPWHAWGAAREASPLLAMGLMAHDRGPFSDRHENGVDLNVEVLFTPIIMLPGLPRPHLGATLNFNGDTSMAYAGLTFPFHDSRRWFGNGFIGGAVHNGPLHKDPVGCQVNSDCGFGVRLLPRFGLEWGYYLDSETAVSLFFDHQSHKWLVEGENEGIDHLGLRYRRPF